MDIKEFFPSIRLPRVLDLFKTAGYLPEVAFSLAKICTLNDVLPQGAATSPSIANILAGPLDRRLLALAQQCELSYTRYADDMVFSGRRISQNIPRLVESIIASEGFSVNTAKTMLARNPQKMMVTGVAISGGRTRLPREKRRALRAALHRAQTAISRPIDASPRQTDAQHLQRLQGSVAHWAHIEPSSEYARRARDNVKALRLRLRTQLKLK